MRRGPGGGAAARPGTGSYALEVTEQSFQALLEASMTGLVLMVFYSPSRMAESVGLADDLTALSDEFDGKFLLGRVDVDASPEIAQAVQVPSVPFVVAVIQGRPAPLFQDVAPLAELRVALTQVMEQLATQGMTGRHQPLARPRGRTRPTPTPRSWTRATCPRRTRWPPATSTARSRSTSSSSRRTRPTPRRPGAWPWPRCSSAREPVDAAAARAAGAERRDDVEAQTLVADLDMLGGHVEDAFLRLVDLVRRTTGAERDQARTHLLGLFAAVGNDDPRVLKGRQMLASALF